MKEFYAIYHSEKVSFWDEKKCTWSDCATTLYHTREEAQEVMDLCGHDKHAVRVILLFNK